MANGMLWLCGCYRIVMFVLFLCLAHRSSILTNLLWKIYNIISLCEIVLHHTAANRGKFSNQYLWVSNKIRFFTSCNLVLVLEFFFFWKRHLWSTLQEEKLCRSWYARFGQKLNIKKKMLHQTCSIHCKSAQSGRFGSVQKLSLRFLPAFSGCFNKSLQDWEWGSRLQSNIKAQEALNIQNKIDIKEKGLQSALWSSLALLSPLLSALPYSCLGRMY